ncbi:MAG: glycosyltransferase family 4 protein [Gammaproteobacteria bacterium]|nr:glycosyltransferase family 4 protein [Gammaproteobacteria bacterium]
MDIRPVIDATVRGKLRLLVDAHVLDGTFQGTRTFIEQLYVEALHLCADEVEFYFAGRDLEALRTVFGTHPHVHYLTLASGNRYLRLARDFPRLIAEHAIDWAHFQYFTPPRKCCRYLVTTHDILFERHPEYFPLRYRLPKHWLIRAAARSADLLTTVSEFSRRELHALYGIAHERIHVIPNAATAGAAASGTAPGAPRPLPPDDMPWLRERPYLLYLSRLEPRKNQLGVLNAVLELGLFERGYSLVFVGARSVSDAAFEARLQGLEQAQREHIHRLDAVPEADKARLLGAARLFVYPSLAEGFGIPPLEAAVAGTPVVCSNLTAMADFDFFAPYHIDPREPSALSDAIARCLEDDDRGRVARIAATVAARYSWRQSARHLMELLLHANQASST